MAVVGEVARSRCWIDGGAAREPGKASHRPHSHLSVAAAAVRTLPWWNALIYSAVLLAWTSVATIPAYALAAHAGHAAAQSVSACVCLCEYVHQLGVW